MLDEAFAAAERALAATRDAPSSCSAPMAGTRACSASSPGASPSAFTCRPSSQPGSLTAAAPARRARSHPSILARVVRDAVHDGLLIKGRRPCHGRRLQARAGGKRTGCWPSSASASPVPVAAATASRPLAIDGALSVGGANHRAHGRCSIAPGPMDPAIPSRASSFRRIACRACASSRTSMSAARSPPQTARASRLRLPRRRYAARQAAAQGEGTAAACRRASPPRRAGRAGTGVELMIEDAAEPRGSR